MSARPRVRAATASRLASWWSRPLAIPVAAGLLAVGFTVFQAALHNVFMGVTEYDDGVYVGAAMRLVTGVLPYHDYVFVQPPGIIVALSPLALLGRLLGTRDTLLAARVLTMLVTGLNAGLVSWLVRERGRTAMAIAGGGLALFPLAVTADHTVMLEPYLVLFMLIGALYGFGRGDGTRADALIAGAAFGVAGTIKIWAVLPFLAAAVCWAPRWRTRVAPLAAGAVGAFALVCLPFALFAPAAFAHEVLADQLGRHAAVVNGRGLSARLSAITGVRGIPLIAAIGVATTLVVVAMLALVALSYGVRRRELRRSDVFVLLASVANVTGLLGAPEFYLHYAYFSAPLLAAAVATSVGLALASRAVPPPARRDRGAPARRVATVVACALVDALVLEDGANARAYLATAVRASNGAVVDPAAAIDSVTPAGSCLVFDEGVLAIEANRFTSDVPGCPDVVDPCGMWLADADGRTPPAAQPYPAAFVATWRSYLEAAQYLVTWVPDSDYIPFDTSLPAWFSAHYRLVYAAPGTYVYSHDVFSG